MSRNIHALFVGIDAYQAPVRPLRGCVNDIRHAAALLKARADAAGDCFKSHELTDAAATRQAIIDAFRAHFRDVKPDDVALFYYSGHGSQQNSPPEFWAIEPDRLDETLVCYDSRQMGSWDLADKELALLVSEVAAKKAHVVVILDCCHSGSGTRNADSTGIRRVPTDHRERPLSAFLAELQSQKIPATRSPEAEKEAGWLALPEGRHILLAACRADEEAKEYSLGGKPRGVFSHFLGETLEQAGGTITYREIYKRVNALVRSHAALQSPQIEPTDQAMLEENFLGGSAGARANSFTLSHDKTVGWVVDGGAVHGIPQPAGNEVAVFAVFPHGSKPEQWRDMKAALGTARAGRVEGHRSRVELTFTKGGPSEKEVYKAVLAALPLPALEVQFGGEAAGLALIREALGKAGATGGPSLLARESQAEKAELRLVARADQTFRILRPADGRQLVGDVAGFSAEAAKKAVERLEHIARWLRIAALRNPVDTLAGKVELAVYAITGDAAKDAKPVDGVSLRMLYTRDAAGKWRAPKFKVTVTNRSEVPLYISLLGLTQTYGVDTSLLADSMHPIAPGGVTSGRGGKEITTVVPKQLWDSGIIEVRDVLKVIASTEELDATLLEQGDLDHPVTAKASTRGFSKMSTLGRLMRRVQTRAFGGEPEEDEKIAEWTTQEFTFTTVRPLESTPLSKVADAELYPGVKLLSHSTLEARARLTVAPVASRDVAGGLVLPPLLRDDPAVSQPFLLSSSRGGEPGLSVLELHDVQNHAAVTREQPLRLAIAQPLAPGEHLLPVTHDGEFFLPIGRGIGRGDHIEVVLDALPPPINTRSLFGAVRIFFQKIIAEKFGTQYQYPLLAAFEPGGDDRGQVIADPAVVKEKVAQAKRIALYIHGIIGETRGMVETAAGLPPIPGLGARYDLILTFDYENLNTPIEENARLLKQRLADAGLGAGHDKTLHVIAHSMGGLISRWFIEREGGQEVVQHLVMLGTPNGGSPWSTIEELAVTALSFGLNGLAPIPYAGKILGGLVSAMEKIDVALGQMKPSSEFLTSLHQSPDPKIPYTIIAGNTSLIAPASAEKEKVRRRLLERLKSLNLLHVATAPAFFGEANDIAVSVANIHRQPGGRALEAKVSEVACDHLTYFSTEAGLRALGEALP